MLRLLCFSLLFIGSSSAAVAAPIHIPIPGFSNIPESLITLRETEIPKTEYCRAINVQSGEHNLVGVLHLPVTPQPENGFPVVILFHGFRGSKSGGIHESKPAYRMIAQKLSKMGIACVRMDMAGCGDSEGVRDTIPISTYLQNGSDILRAVSEYPEIDRHRIGVAGFSLGCHTACYLASRLYQNCTIRAVSIWAAVADGGVLCKEMHDKIFSDNNFANNVGISFGFGPPPLILNGDDVSSFLAIQDHVLMNTLPSPIRVLCLHGTEDTIVSMAHNKLFFHGHSKNMNFIIYENTGHDIAASPHIQTIISDITSHFKTNL